MAPRPRTLTASRSPTLNRLSYECISTLHFRVPDFHSYFSSHGITYEMVTGYRVSSRLRFDFEFERVFQGDTLFQFTPRVHYNLFPNLKIISDLVISQGIGGSLAVYWQCMERLNVWARFIQYNAYSLYGERNSIADPLGTPEVGVNIHFTRMGATHILIDEQITEEPVKKVGRSTGISIFKNSRFELFKWR